MGYATEHHPHLGTGLPAGDGEIWILKRPRKMVSRQLAFMGYCRILGGGLFGEQIDNAIYRIDGLAFSHLIPLTAL